MVFFFFQAEDGIRDWSVTGVQTCALPILPGLSVKKVERLHQELGISTVEELKAACESHQLRDVKGFGAKTEQNILAAIALAGTGSQDREQRIHIHHALRAGGQIVEYLATTPGFDQGALAGSVRRWQGTAARIVVCASGEKPKRLN